eukprot:28574-Pelagococcus_subviridis.AAC.1
MSSETARTTSSSPPPSPPSSPGSLGRNPSLAIAIARSASLYDRSMIVCASATFRSRSLYGATPVATSFGPVRAKRRTSGRSRKASVEVERRASRRETPGEVLKKRRSPRDRGRMGTSVR